MVYCTFVVIGGRTADAIVDTALSKLKSLVQDRLKGRGGSSGRSGGSGGKVKKFRKYSLVGCKT